MDELEEKEKEKEKEKRRGGRFKDNHFDLTTTPALRATPPVPGGELLLLLFLLLLQFIHTFFDRLAYRKPRCGIFSCSGFRRIQFRNRPTPPWRHRGVRWIINDGRGMQVQEIAA